MSPTTFAKTIEGIFFKSAQAGYVGSTIKTTIPALPGSKVISFEEGEWLVRDVYFVNNLSGMSFGTTTIWNSGRPVWYMNYNGWYQEDAIQFLKEVLFMAYVAQYFNGGRGPEEMRDENRRMVYQNHLTVNEFRHFSGVEEIWDFDQKLLGTHRYEGRLLIEPHS